MSTRSECKASSRGFGSASYFGLCAPMCLGWRLGLMFYGRRKLGCKRLFKRLKVASALSALFYFSFSAMDAFAIDLIGRAAFGANYSRVSVGSNHSEVTLHDNQQSLRLMAAENASWGLWSLHAILARSENDLITPFWSSVDLVDQATVFERLRHRAASGTVFDRYSGGEFVQVKYLIDRAFFQYDWSSVALKFGRQAVDFGLGRLWQPLNVFGAFVPNALDTDYKSGIDAINLTFFSGVDYEVRVLHVFGGNEASDASSLQGRLNVGGQAHLLWLAASLPGSVVYGVGVESEWAGWGWRVETSYAAQVSEKKWRGFWIAGVDRQVFDDIYLTVEWYRHGAGVSSVESVSQLQGSTNEVATPLSWLDTTRQMPVRDQLGFAVSKSLTPLVQAQWLTLAAKLTDHEQGKAQYAFGHQLSLLGSLSDESDVLFAVFKGVGRRWSESGVSGSSYADVPLRVSLRWRIYF